MSLREAFGELSGSAGRPDAADLEGFRAAIGHPDLPDNLLIEALVSYANTASTAVAEQLAPLVMAYTGIVTAPEGAEPADPARWLQVLATVPETETETEVEAVDRDDAVAAPAPVGAGLVDQFNEPDPLDLDFGVGSGPRDTSGDRADLWEPGSETFEGERTGVPLEPEEPPTAEPVEPPTGSENPFFDEPWPVADDPGPTLFGSSQSEG